MVDILDRARIGNIGLLDTSRRRQDISRLNGEDYPEGLVIQELRFDGDGSSRNVGRPIRLLGNQMPHVPFMYGGEQRINKMYYPGHPEPSVQVLGPQEGDVTINGEFKDFYLDSDFEGFSELTRDRIDILRHKGSLCKFTLGAWERYGHIGSVKWEVVRKVRIRYQIVLVITSFRTPVNGKYLNQTRGVPFALNERLLEQLSEIEAAQDRRPNLPDRSISEQIDALVGEVGNAIAEINNYVENIFTQIENIRRSVNRARALVEHTKNSVENLVGRLSSINPFSFKLSIADRYRMSAYNSEVVSYSSILTGLLVQYDIQLSQFAASIPIARHLVQFGDTWQTIAGRYYDGIDNWKQIPEFNNLEAADAPPIGTFIDIPEVV